MTLPEPQVRSKNEAAERLRRLCLAAIEGDEQYEASDLLDAALAWERRRTEQLAQWISRHYLGSTDGACRECVGDVYGVVDGFQCAPHRARAILTESETSDDR